MSARRKCLDIRTTGQLLMQQAPQYVGQISNSLLQTNPDYLEAIIPREWYTSARKNVQFLSRLHLAVHCEQLQIMLRQSLQV
jgi:hypothetical protein